MRDWAGRQGYRTRGADVAVNTDSYIGRAPCGCIRTWISDKSPAADIRRHVMAAMTAGLHVERANTDEARRARWGCEQCDPTSFQCEMFAGGAA